MENQYSIKIFVVDDDFFSLNLYQQHLQNLGYQDVTSFNNGMDCLNALTQMPQIIFLDYGMEVLNGIDILKKIKRFNPNIYVVFISGQEDVTTAVNSLKYGAFDYIVKGQQELKKMETVLDKIQEVDALLQKNNKNFIKKIFSKF